MDLIIYSYLIYVFEFLLPELIKGCRIDYDAKIRFIYTQLIFGRQININQS